MQTLDILYQIWWIKDGWLSKSNLVYWGVKWLGNWYKGITEALKQTHKLQKKKKKLLNRFTVKRMIFTTPKPRKMEKLKSLRFQSNQKSGVVISTQIPQIQQQNTRQQVKWKQMNMGNYWICLPPYPLRKNPRKVVSLINLQQIFKSFRFSIQRKENKSQLKETYLLASSYVNGLS